LQAHAVRVPVNQIPQLIGVLGGGSSRQVANGQGEVGSVFGEKTSQGDVERDKGGDDAQCTTSLVHSSLACEFTNHPKEQIRKIRVSIRYRVVR
jgi:hypothetical protein